MWRVEIRPEFHDDATDAADWYDQRKPGLGSDFVDEVIRVLDSLAENPLLNARRHATRNIRWRYTDRFPYRVIYEVVESEQIVVVAALLHAARHELAWLRRMVQ